MTTLKTISAALKLVETKKENLKKAYDDLQSHSSLLSSSSFPHTWSHLDSHFTSLHNSLSQRFKLLEQQCLILNDNNDNNNPTHNDPSPSNSKLSNPNPKDANFSSFPNDPSTQNEKLASNHAQHLSALCKANSGTGLRTYIGEHYRDKSSIKVDLEGALKCSSDPPTMVLDALDGVVGENAVNDFGEVRRMKRSCGVLFQVLRVVCPNVTAQVRKRAKRVFLEWKRSLVNDDNNNIDGVGAMAFLHFVAAYGLLSELSITELATISASAAANDELSELYQIIGLTDKVPGLVKKLVDKGKHILAVKYVFEFDLADKIKPVPILHAYVNETKKLAKRLSQEGKSLTEVRAREIHALKQVIKVIENHNLESEFPRASLEQRIEELKKPKANVKHVAPAKPPQHQQSGIKRPRTSVPVGPLAVVNNVNSASSTVQHYQQPLYQSTGLLPEHPNPYMGLQAMPYGLVAPTPAFSSYPGPSTGPYGHAGVPMGPTGNPGQGESLPNPLEPHVPSGYHDSVPAYGGYGLQHYYQASYPQ